MRSRYDHNIFDDKDAINLEEGAYHAPLRDVSWRRKPRSLSSFVAGFKSSVTKRIQLCCNQSNSRIWQRNYYESIVRNERHLNQIRQYILDNPQKWSEDPEKAENDSQELLIDFIPEEYVEKARQDTGFKYAYLVEKSYK